MPVVTATVGLDYLVPLALGLAGILAFALVYLRAVTSRPPVTRRHRRAARVYQPRARQAYQVSAVRSWAALLASTLFTLALTLALVRWLPLSALESTLLGTLIAPLVWPVALAYLLAEPRWLAANLIVGVTGAVALAAIALLTVS